MKSMTDKVRAVMLALFVIIVLSGLAGWLIKDRDTAKLQTLLATVAIGVFTAEASAVGKRATFKKEAIGSEIPEG